MLRRVGVIGDAGAVEKRLGNEADEYLVESLSPDGEPPGNTAFVATGGAEAEASVHHGLILSRRRDELLFLLADAIDLHEGLEEGMSRRVMNHAARYAHVLQLRPDDRSRFERAALFRDLGMIKVPNQALMKEGVLDYDDWVLLQRHPHTGAEVAEGLADFADTAEIIRHHHECFDGDGYPDQLHGEDIPYLARALKIVDVYCAMTSPRHYREGQATPEEGVDHLKSERGKHFDPELVDAFVDGGVATELK